MELNRIMILFSGCFLLVWSTYKWKRPYVIWDAKLTRVYSVILGLYNIILAIYFKKDLSIILFVLDLVLSILLDIGFIMIKLKKDKKGIIKNLQLGICSVFVVLALGMVYFNLNEIYSSVMILSGMMMVLSTPFEEARSLWKEH
jgi:hypothetical protein